MALILERAISSYHSTFTDHIDPRSSDWLLVRSIFVPFSISVVYLFFVKKWGPAYMAKRDAFKIDTLMILYNIGQIWASFHLFWKGAHLWTELNYSFLCQPVDKNDSELNDQLHSLVYMYYAIKITDLLDTVFFILRKNFRQVTFLHVYHHVGMVFAGYLGCKFSLNGHFTLLGLINSFVHVLMYTYYLASAIWPQFKQNLLCKKSVTLVQLAQFCILVLHESLPLFQPTCQVQRIWCYLLVTQYVFMIILFSDFYKKAYLDKKEKKDT